MSKEKYRPYLSLHQIELITTLLLSHSPEERELIKSLQLISLKASSGLATPSYISSPRAPSKYSAAGLGLEDMTDDDINKLFPGTSES